MLILDSILCMESSGNNYFTYFLILFETGVDKHVRDELNALNDKSINDLDNFIDLLHFFVHFFYLAN